MKILHVINSVDIGGAETLLAALLENWSAEDENHVLVLQSRGPLHDRFTRAAESVHYLNCTKSSFQIFRMIQGLRKFVSRLNPEIVHSHLVQSDLVSLLTPSSGAARLTSIHVSSLMKSDPLRSRVIARIVGLLSYRLDGAICTSDRSEAYARSLSYRCQTKVINNGTSARTAVEYQAEPVTFLSLARFNPVKGHEVLIKAFFQHLEKYPGSKLMCAGEGVSMGNPDFVEMLNGVELYDRKQQAVEFLGPRLDVSPLFSAASALVISSVGNETFPMVGSEACMAGVPVLTTDVGNARDFTVDPRAVAEPGSDQSMKEMLSWFAALPSIRRKEMAADSHAKAVQRFDITSTTNDYRCFYAACLDRSIQNV